MKQIKRNVRCRTTELLISSFRDIHKCTRDAYLDSHPPGNISDPNFTVNHKFCFCGNFSYCNSCGIRIKTNRFLKNSYMAVDIKLID